MLNDKMGAAGSVIPDEIDVEAFKELTGGYTTAVFEESKLTMTSLLQQYHLIISLYLRQKRGGCDY